MNLLKKLNNSKIWGRLAIILPVGLIAFLISEYCFQIMLIQGESMSPTYHSGQLAIIDRLTTDISRGDVIVFRCENVEGLIVKRVVALPGDSIVIENGILYVNDEPDSYYPYIEYAGNAGEKILLGSDEYFVLGDNVTESRDSRYDEIGVVTGENIYGKILK